MLTEDRLAREAQAMRDRRTRLREKRKPAKELAVPSDRKQCWCLRRRCKRCAEDDARYAPDILAQRALPVVPARLALTDLYRVQDPGSTVGVYVRIDALC